VSCEETEAAIATGGGRDESPRSDGESEAQTTLQLAPLGVDQPGPGSAGHREVYTHGYGKWVQDWMSQRTAAEAADFLLPHLRPGMRVLDCGCGPGSISADLATLVAPGELIGIDIEPRQLELARALAADRGVGNVRFQLANIYELPFPKACFDAVFAHTVVEHLAEPRLAFAEVRRVLKPSGIFGVRDPDYSTWRMEPAMAGLDNLVELVRSVQQINGGSPYYAPRQRELLLEAGFARSEGGASAMYAARPDQMELLRSLLEEQMREGSFIDAAFRSGYDKSALKRLLKEATAWSARPDAFWALMMCHAVGWAS
jgi:ubiquinone/menaquinone biosynthesis C-methylase UbiE